jgi:cysteinyl-tRNA synthetase
MTLRIYNTLTRTKEEFRPLDPKNVRMYVCGPTVYDFAHIGNARPVIVFDVLYRLLKHLASKGEWDDGKGETKVTYVRNITDVDDKINARALERFPGVPLNEAIRKVTESTANQFFADAKALGCLEPDVQPRATEHIAGMIDMISVLIKKGNAYVAAGEVLFDVGSMPDYGRLSQRKLEDQQAGARVAVEAHKKNPADFVLWKLSSADEPGWDSPWGRGRPGWHIECSVMSKSHLGEVFDIHGGGLDLIFPHHENEIAQSRCAHGTSVMANYWMHNGFLQVEGQKMSKSLGNFVTIADVLKDWPGEVVRFNMLRTHYRQPIDWTHKSMRESEGILRELSLQCMLTKRDSRPQSSEIEKQQLLAALCDDLNLHLAISVLQANAVNLSNSTWSFAQALLGVDLEKYAHHSGLMKQLSEAEHANIDALVSARLAARAAKDWKESDRIRDELLAMGIQIMDKKDPATGELKTEWEVRR